MPVNDIGKGDDQTSRRIRITSFDVAAEAGVSQSTVSRALAGDPVVSEATRERVRAAASKLNYHVDENAARLRTGRTGTLAVVVVCRPEDNMSNFNPFYYSLLGSICAAASRRGYETLVSFQDIPERLWGCYQEQRKADGLIVIGTTENRDAWAYFREIAASGAHLVCWGAPHDDLDWVRSDNHAGSALAVNHLYKAGYRHIVCVASESSPQRQFKERYDGYVEACRALELQPHLVSIDKGFSREEQGRRAAEALIGLGKHFDAIYAVCDEIALGVLRTLYDHKIRVPEDVGVVGFDGIRAGAHSSPPLTSIEPDFQVAGTMLVDRILAAMAGDNQPKERVPISLLQRGSSTPLSGR